MPYVKLTLIGLALLGIGTGIGYYATPTKTVTVTKVVTKTVREKIINRNVDVKIVRSIDAAGNPVITITRIDRSTEHSGSTTDGTSVTHTTTERVNKDWLLSGAYLLGASNQREISGSISRRIIGQVYVGAFGTSEGRFGLGVTIAF